MCRTISFFHNPNTGAIKVWDLSGHSETEEHLKLDGKYWREGHYLPDEKVECRVLETDKYDQKFCNERLKAEFPTFVSFLNYCLKQLKYKVGGYLDLSHTKITSLPDNLKVTGNLDLSHTKIKSLPDNLNVGFDLYLSNTKITSLPANLTVGGKIVGGKIR